MRPIYSVPALILLAIIAFVLAKGAVKIVMKEQESRERVEVLREQASAQALREEMLLGNIARLQTPEGIEEEIKDKFNVVPDGEEVAIIVDDKRVATSTNDSKKSWYKKILDVIMKDK